MIRKTGCMGRFLVGTLISVFLGTLSLAFQPGYPIVRECPKCKKPVLQATMESGNTFGARLWTDSKQEAPMLLDAFLLAKCPHCASLFWINEARKLGEQPFRGEPRWPAAKEVLEPSEYDYYLFLRAPTRNQKDERYLRIRAMWRMNDPRRAQQGTQLPPSGGEAARNLEALYAVLGASTGGKDRLFRAEVARELGRFSECLLLLAKGVPPKEDWAAAQIRTLAERRDPGVRELQFPKNQGR